MVTIDLHTVISRFLELGYTTIGNSKMLSKENKIKLDQQILLFFQQYPLILQDQSFYVFLENYLAASIDWPDESIFIDIFGLDTNITLNIYTPDRKLTVTDGLGQDRLLIFSEIVIVPGPDGEKQIGGIYAFSISTNNKMGVYQKLEVWSQFQKPGALAQKENVSQYTWYCDTFAEWLLAVVNAGGKLPLLEWKSNESDPTTPSST